MHIIRALNSFCPYLGFRNSHKQNRGENSNDGNGN